MAKILILNGPNLNMLGTREASIYGQLTLSELTQQLQEPNKYSPHQIICQQSNAEYELIEWIQQAPSQQVNYIIINPAALTHTSIGLRDALLAVAIPFIEVHISNIHSRESFRHKSYLSDIAMGIICGLGPYGYHLAVQAIINKIES